MLKECQKNAKSANLSIYALLPFLIELCAGQCYIS